MRQPLQHLPRSFPGLLFGLLVSLAGLLPFVAASAAPPDTPDAEIPREDLWYVVEMLGQRAGYMHVETGPTQHQGQPAVASRVHLYNAVPRKNGGIQETVTISTRTLWVEDLEGNTLLVEQELEQGGGISSRTRLEVQGDRARLTLQAKTRAAGDVDDEGTVRQAEIPWDESIAGQRTLEQEVDRLLSGEATEVTVPTFSLEAGGRILEVKLRLVERRQDGSAIIEQDLLDLGVTTREEYRADGTMVRQEVGPVVIRLADRRQALEPLEQSLAAFEQVSVRLDRSLEHPRQLRTAAFRLVPRPGGEDLRMADLFPADQRQRVEVGSNGEVLRVEVHTEGAGRSREAIDAEPYLGGSSLIESDDPEIQALARRIVTADAPSGKGKRRSAASRQESLEGLEAAQRLERWVREHIGFSGSGVGLATAKQTLDSRDGDCTENAFLLTALLRAAGIPARVVVGLVYSGDTSMVPHAWAEAHLEGGWRAFDSAVYSSPVDATHLAMAKSAGREEGALLEVTAPLLNVLGRFDLAWVPAAAP